MKYLTWLALFISLMWAPVQAEPAKQKPSPDPYATMQQVIDSTFVRLKDARVDGQIPDGQIEQIIEQEMMPYVDYRYAAYKVIGKHLRSTEAEQRERFINAFYHYLITTYAQALGQYDNQQVVIEPKQSLEGKKIVSIAAAIKDDGRPDINLTFKFRKQKKTDDWFAFDMIAEGISLLSAKQSEIGPMIGKQGIDEVIILLEQKRQQPEPETQNG